MTAAEEKQALEIAVDAWKKTVDVQQHFNTIEMQIRNLGITVVTAAIAAAAVLRSRSVAPQTCHGHSVQLAASTSSGWASGMIVFGALIAWAAFYFMDRWWYHRFLGAAGVEAGRLEVFVSESLHSDVLNLSRGIADASPIQVGGRTIRSTQKIDIFYGMVGALIAIVMIVFFLS